MFLCSWQNDVFVVAEPGEQAEKFVQSVKHSLMCMMRCRRRRNTSIISNISTVSELVSCRPYFQIGGVVHRFIGRQTQVNFNYFFFDQFIGVDKLIFIIFLISVIIF